ncbi:MAG TPA: stage II sporulation protein M [Planctomycetota bacterium]|nr:stage II sporulation protein M [Planctomycetota bacterium]
MDIDHFIAERKPNWVRLGTLLDAFERTTEWDMGHERIKELVTLYRQACTDLNQARTYTASPELLETLNQLTGRAYRFVYAEGGRKSVRETFWRFISVSIPETFQRESRYVLYALLPFVAGIVVGFVAIKINPSYEEVIVPAQFRQITPKEHVAQVEGTDGERIDSVQTAAALSSFLYTNNIKCAFVVFALAAMTMIGGIYYLFWTGTWLGAIACLYHDSHFVQFFYAWVGPHGALELPSIIFAGAAGLRFGRAVLMPGNLTRASAVREAFTPVWRMLCATAMMLVCAGLIEGSFSQFSSKTVPYNVKIGVAIVLFVSMVTYLFVLKRDRLKDGAASK